MSIGRKILAGVSVFALASSLFGAGVARVDVEGSEEGVAFSQVEASPGAQIRDLTKKRQENAKYFINVDFPAEKDSWREGSVSFTPDSDGKVALLLGGPWMKDKDQEKAALVLFDDVKAEGASLVNGDFESEGGWKLDPFPEAGYAAKYLSDGKSAHGGKGCVVVQHGSEARQKLKVKANVPVKISFWFKLK